VSTAVVLTTTPPVKVNIAPSVTVRSAFVSAFTLPVVAPPVVATSVVTSTATSAVSSAASAAAPVPHTRARLTHSTLFAAVQARPNETIAVIADRLANQYGWTPAERLSHLRRLYDIRRSIALTTIQSRLMVPIIHTPESVHGYFQALGVRYEQAQRQWEEEEEQ
jgi:hypothetical protein